MQIQFEVAKLIDLALRIYPIFSVVTDLAAAVRDSKSGAGALFFKVTKLPPSLRLVLLG